jgi:hypothetical protein
MDEYQERLVRVGLGVLAEYGFALAGGYALQAHQLVDRLSEDVDLFTDRWDTEDFSRAVDAVVEAFKREVLEVSVPQREATFCRLEITDPSIGKVATVDMASDFRQDEPVTLSVGPVIAESDAVASKVAAVFSRGYARDYLDLAGILESGRFPAEQLMQMAERVDAGFSKGWFAEALAAVDRFQDQDFTRYGVDAARVSRVREIMRDWSDKLRHEVQPAELEPGAHRTATPDLGHEAGRKPPGGPSTLEMRRTRLDRLFRSTATSTPDELAPRRGIEL